MIKSYLQQRTLCYSYPDTAVNSSRATYDLASMIG